MSPCGARRAARRCRSASTRPGCNDDDLRRSWTRREPAVRRLRPVVRAGSGWRAGEDWEAVAVARGRLRVYLGAAPGVGKSYAMLAGGQRGRSRGTGVVIGLVETHGRRLTADMAEGLELVPRRTLVYRGRAFTEMDLDAVLARRPQVALIDELAHSNVPGSRNDKRWQDVEELLDAGIDVVSTLNIQHLDSLNDVVEQITGVKQYETIPDEVVRRAEQVELVDMTPEALRRRMVH